MPKVFKAYNVNMDTENRVNIDVTNVALLMANQKSAELKESNAGFVERPLVSESEAIEAVENKQSEDPEEKSKKVIDEAIAESNRILDKANMEADSIVEEARIRAQALAIELKEESKKDGYNIGYEKGIEDSNEIKRQSEKIYNDALKEKQELINSIESDMIDLVVKIINKLLPDIVNLNPKVVLNLIKQGLEGATLSGEINIHVSQHDYDEVVKNKFEILLNVDTSSKVEIIKDLSLNKSDCIIETRFGDIDCSLDQQFNALKQNLYYIYESR